jgi:DNA polymerase-3 subunit beta
MNILIKKELLLKGLRNVINIVSQKTTMPILSNILLETGQNKLLLSATDLDISITTALETEVKKEGAITVSSKSFFEIVRELPNQIIEISVNENMVIIKSDNGQYKLAGLSKDEFPAIPKDAAGEKVEMDFALLKSMVERTLFAVSKNDTRKELNGVFWKLVGDESTMAATDGHKLSKIKRRLKKKITAKKEVIVPPKALEHFVRLVGEGEEGQEVCLADNYITFRFANTSLVSRLIEGPYPNYEQVVPYNNDKELHVNREQLISSIRRVAIFSDFQTHQVRFALKKDKVVLSAVNRDMNGEAHEEIAASFKSKDMDLGYNSTYLAEILKQFDTEEIIFKLSEPLVAGLVFPENQKKEEEQFCLIMPLKLDA